MGEIAEAMKDGLLCKQCGAVVDGKAPGRPRSCADCKKRRPSGVRRW